MKFSTTAVLGLLFVEQAAPFTPVASPRHKSSTTSSSSLSMAMDMPPPLPPTTPAPAIIEKNKYGPSDVRYSEFIKLVNANKIEAVTFSADGTQLLGVDADGTRLKIESLPNDPALLSQLTSHKVCVV